MSDELILYQYPGNSGVPSLSPPCAKVFLALQQLDLPHRVVSLKSPLQVKKVSATGRVPVLEHGGTRTVDSVACLDVLEGLHEDPPWPQAPAARARDRAWEHFANDTLYFLLVYLRWSVPEHMERTVAGMFPRGGWLTRFMVKTFGGRETRARLAGQGTGLLSLAEVLAKLERELGTIRDGLSEAPLLAGERPGRGDLAVATAVANLGWRGALPRIAGHLERHPEVVQHCRRTFEACGLPAPEWVAAG